MDVILRWYIWGRNDLLHNMLKYSVLSFQKYLQDRKFRYVLACEDKDFTLNHTNLEFDKIVDIRLGPFYHPVSLFKKFGPRFRFNPIATEIYIDSDIFCIKQPIHLMEFINSDHYVGMIQSRRDGQKSRFGFGGWLDSVAADVPPCCAGLLGFKPHYDFTDEFICRMFQSFNMPDSHFNEQGAVVKCMEKEILAGKIKLMYEPAIRYYLPPDYNINLDQPDCEMIHCIGTNKDHFENVIKLL